MKTVSVRCPVCQQRVGVKLGAQVTCPECGSWFPADWAKELELFEAQRRAVLSGIYGTDTAAAVRNAARRDQLLSDLRMLGWTEAECEAADAEAQDARERDPLRNPESYFARLEELRAAAARGERPMKERS